MPHSLLTSILISVLTCFISIANAQFPTNKLLGGSSSEFYTRNSLDGDGHPVITRQTSDGGYILVASTLTSANGDVTPTNHGGNDIWVVKFSANGVIEWQKLIGGNQDEYAFQVHQTSDGGYIIAANSNSSQSGDVTQTSRGEFDFWIVKLTSTGTISWNKLIGGSDTDFLSDLNLTSDGGCVATGFSRSSQSGDITDTNKWDKDFLVVKLSASGTVSWNKLLGGNKTEGPSSIYQTPDGGYIVGGHSDTDNDGEVTNANHGYYDMWLVKLNATGAVQWNKLYGGLNYEGLFALQIATDGGYILAGLSQSSSTGDVVGNNKGGYDAWVLKVDNVGNIVWKKLIGGESDEFVENLYQNPDGSLMLVGYSTSSASGDIASINHGDFDYWITKISAAGDIAWSKLYGGTGNDRAFSISKKNDGNLIISGITSSSANGDVKDTNHGETDLWLLTIDINGNIVAQTPPPSNAPIAHYPFNGNANDESGNGNNGVPSNATLTTDRFGKANSAYLFNGSDSRIDINKAFFDIGWDSFTISCWINSSSVDNANNYNNSQVILNTDPHNGIALNGYGSTNPFKPEVNKKYSFLAGTQPSVRNWDVLPLDCISKSNRTINTWNHLVVVKTGTTYSLYINGIFDKSFVGLKSVPSNLCKMVLGNLAANIPNEGFLGKLDDFSIWNRGLSQTEITKLYDSTKVETSQIDLSLTSKSLNQTVKKDSTGQISFTLKNSGSSKASNIKVLLKIPYSPPFVAKNSQNCSKGTFDSNVWTIPELAVGDSCVLNVIYQPTQSGVWYVEAEVFSTDQEDADSTPKNGIDTEDDFTRACLTIPISVTQEPFGMQLILEDPKIVVYQWYKDGNVIQGENKNTLQIKTLGKYSYDSKNYKCPSQGCCPFILEKSIVAPTCCSPLEYILERKN
jgi:Concanavalin A-like lectin/glucanases superfamily/Domain of unknown function DUF11